MLRRLAQYEDREVREKLSRDHYRLGRILTRSSGPHGVSEVWEEGHAARVSSHSVLVVEFVSLLHGT